MRDYDEAIAWFTGALGMEVIQDEPLYGDRRWVLVGRPDPRVSKLVLAKGSTPEEELRVGEQTRGGGPMIFRTDDCWRDYRAMLAHGVRFQQEPREAAHGILAEFTDLYGNPWHLLEYRSALS